MSLRSSMLASIRRIIFEDEPADAYGVRRTEGVQVTMAAGTTVRKAAYVALPLAPVGQATNRERQAAHRVRRLRASASGRMEDE